MADFKTPANSLPAIDEDEEPVAAPPAIKGHGDAGSRPTVFSDDVRAVEVTYEVVEHDGGWAYRLGDTFSEPFPTRGAAVDAAAQAASEHLQPDEDEIIEFQDEDGSWHSEVARGGDRPVARVVDLNPVRQGSAQAPRSAPPDSFETVAEAVRRRPILSVAIAAAIGFILGSR